MRGTEREKKKRRQRGGEGKGNKKKFKDVFYIPRCFLLQGIVLHQDLIIFLTASSRCFEEETGIFPFVLCTYIIWKMHSGRESRNNFVSKSKVSQKQIKKSFTSLRKFG